MIATLEIGQARPVRKIIVVGCGQSKLTRAAKAEELYCGPLFSARRRYAVAAGVPWFVASSKYGLVDPSKVIEPYEQRLKAGEAGVWGVSIVRSLIDQLDKLGFAFGSPWACGRDSAKDDFGLEFKAPRICLEPCRVEWHLSAEYWDGVLFGLCHVQPNPFLRDEMGFEGLPIGKLLAWYSRRKEGDGSPLPYSGKAVAS